MYIKPNTENASIHTWITYNINRLTLAHRVVERREMSPAEEDDAKTTPSATPSATGADQDREEVCIMSDNDIVVSNTRPPPPPTQHMGTNMQTRP